MDSSSSPAHHGKWWVEITRHRLLIWQMGEVWHSMTSLVSPSLQGPLHQISSPSIYVASKASKIALKCECLKRTHEYTMTSPSLLNKPCALRQGFRRFWDVKQGPCYAEVNAEEGVGVSAALDLFNSLTGKIPMLPDLQIFTFRNIIGFWCMLH